MINPVFDTTSQDKAIDNAAVNSKLEDYTDLTVFRIGNPPLSFPLPPPTRYVPKVHKKRTKLA